jgi:hypothetical protein
MAKKRLAKHGRRMMGLYAIYFVVLALFVIAPTAIIMQVVLGNAFTSFIAGGVCTGDSLLSDLGISHKSSYCVAYDAIQKQLGGKQIKELKGKIGAETAAALDCTNATPQEQQNKECISGLMQTAEGISATSPIPPRASWLVPIWQAAAAKYNVPWELLAAVNGTRTYFGLYDCQQNSNEQGAGFYRQNARGGYLKYPTQAGHAVTAALTSQCTTSKAPYKLESVQDYGANIYDAVDATFTEARMLAARGASAAGWDYNGHADTGGAGVGSGTLLVPGQQTFAEDLASQSGLNASVIEAWELAEESGTAAQSRAAANNNNWLNIGYFNSGAGQIAFNQAFKEPSTAATQTDKFLMGQWGGASKGIRAILSSITEGTSGQVKAIQESGWAVPTPEGYVSSELAEIGGSGSGATGITTPIPDGTPFSDGSVFYPPTPGEGQEPGSGAVLGSNSKLELPPGDASEAAQYRSNLGSWRPVQEDSCANPMPTAVISQFLTDAWNAFGVHGKKAQEDVQANLQQVSTESGGCPNIIQGPGSRDANSESFSTLARGLFQFTPSSFEAWKVDGYNDIYNPLDDILAGVNAQVNSSVTDSCGASVLNGCSGWSPGAGANPYKTGGSEKGASTTPTSTTSSPAAAGNVKCTVTPQTDAVSHAVAYDGPGKSMSPCYVAIVNAWYQAIEQDPPQNGGGSGGGSIVEIAQKEIGKGPNPKYWYFDPGEYAEYGTTEWCAAFASWVWHTAGVPNFTGTAGAGEFVTWGQAHNLAHPVGSGYVPKPGDAVVYDYEGGGHAAHVGIVDQVLPNGEIITIEGNYAGGVARVGPFNPTQPRQGDHLQASFFVSPGTYPTGSGSGGEGGKATGSLSVTAATEYAKSQGSTVVGFAVDSTSGSSLGDYQGSSQNIGRSITKTLLLVAYLDKVGSGHLSATASEHLQGMIEQSSNEDADWVFNALDGKDTDRDEGGNPTSDAAVEAVAHAAGMTGFHLSTADPVYVLGESRVTADDMAHFFSQIEALMPSAQRSYGMGLLGSINDPGEPGQAGIYEAGVASGTIHSKSGWESEPSGSYTFNQVAQFAVGSTTYDVSILLEGPSESEDETVMKTIYQKLFSG